MNNPEEVMADVLRRHVPTAEEHQIHHQLEYLKARIKDGRYVIDGGFGQPAVFLHAFYGLDDQLLPALQQALDRFLAQHSSPFAESVMRACRVLRDLNVPTGELWISNRRYCPIEGRFFLGLKVLYHDGPNDFVLSLQYGRCVPLC